MTPGPQRFDTPVQPASSSLPFEQLRNMTRAQRRTRFFNERPVELKNRKGGIVQALKGFRTPKKK